MSKADHRWSGWPGAWCLDCGIEDQNEIALAEDCGHPTDPNVHMGLCLVNHNPPCPEPNSRRHDPYTRHTEAPPC